MFDNIKFKIINADHRFDRKEECLIELKKINFKSSENIFFKAKYIKDFGIRGCALSHAMALSEFLFIDDTPFVIILEDDFQINDPEIFKKSISDALAYSSFWNVFLLGHNQAVPIETISNSNLLRVINSQTMSGYIVNRLYAARLIKLCFEASELLRRFENIPSPNSEIARHNFSPDILWKKMQIDDNFATTFPASITQRSSYSDIQNKHVNYGV